MCQLYVIAGLIQFLNEGLIDDLFPAPDDAIDIGKRHANLLSDIRLSDSLLNKACLIRSFFCYAFWFLLRSITSSASAATAITRYSGRLL